MTELDVPTRALTLWQPWARAVTHHGKDVENRPWPPWPTVVGTFIAIHAGNTMVDEARRMIWEEQGIEIPVADCVRMAIVGVARVVRAFRVDDQAARADPAFGSPWAIGPWCWVLEDVRPIRSPIPCRGSLALWQIPAGARTALAAQLVAA